MKKILIRLRTMLKFFVLVSISILIILCAVMLIYKPIYSVSLNGELLGYCEDKSKLQSEITEYSEKGDSNINTNNLAFVSIDTMPTYKMCLLKRGVTTNDEEILNKIKETGIPYYKYYAILNDDEEMFYVSNFETALEIIDSLKKKQSDNIASLSIDEKYETELKEFTDKDIIVEKLYKEKPKVVVAKRSTLSTNVTVSTARNMSYSKVALGISLIRPVSGRISSRFGSMSRLRSGAHTGLDIAASSGTSIKAAASGIVVFSGTKGAYGKMVAINHGNGVLTYYGHCSKLYVSVGEMVDQGDVIAAVGSTGNSTGPHLHLEIRVNGVAYNPQKYVY